MHEPDRLARYSAARPGYAGDRHRQLDRCVRQRAARHGFRGLLADGAEALEQCWRHAEHRLLGGVAVGHEGPVDDVGRTGNVGQRGRDKSAGTGLQPS